MTEVYRPGATRSMQAEGLTRRKSLLCLAGAATFGAGLVGGCGGGGGSASVTSALGGEGGDAMVGGSPSGSVAVGGSNSASAGSLYLWRRQAGAQRYYRIANRASAQPEVVHQGVYVLANEPSTYTVADLVPAKGGKHFVVYGWSSRSSQPQSAFAVHQLGSSGQVIVTHTIRQVPGYAQFASLSHGGRYLAIGLDESLAGSGYVPVVLVFDLASLGADSVNPMAVLTIDSRNPSDPAKLKTCFWTPRDSLMLTHSDGSLVLVHLTGGTINYGTLPRSLGGFTVHATSDLSYDGLYLVGALEGPASNTGIKDLEYWVSDLTGFGCRQATAMKVARAPSWSPDGRLFGHRSDSASGSSGVLPGTHGYDFSFLAPREASMLTESAAQSMSINRSAGFPNTEVGTASAVLTR